MILLPIEFLIYEGVNCDKSLFVTVLVSVSLELPHLCSGLMLDYMLGLHSWRTWNHRGCWGLNPGQLYKMVYTISLSPKAICSCIKLSISSCVLECVTSINYSAVRKLIHTVGLKIKTRDQRERVQEYGTYIACSSAAEPGLRPWNHIQSPDHRTRNPRGLLFGFVEM